MPQEAIDDLRRRIAATLVPAMSLFGTRDRSDALPVEGHLPDFDRATGWLNSDPLTADDVRGKVVLVDFWTYTCINWLRTLGYVRAWADRYRKHGLVVVGVHTPEFPFERDVDNVREAVAGMDVRYPVALDSEYDVWRAFGNRYWPAVYIADAQGQIRHHQFGEGGYEECERVVQQLLREAGGEKIPDDLVSVAGEGFEAQADWANLKTPETYLGYEQGRNLASPDDAAIDEPRTYSSRIRCASTSGLSPGTGRSRAGRACSTGPAGRSRFASTPAMSISSCRLRRAVPP